MPGVRGGHPGPPDPGRPGGDGRWEPSGSTAVGLLPARRGTAGRRSKKLRCSIRKGSLPRTNDGAPRIRGPPESPMPAPPAPIRFPGGHSTT